MEGVDDYDQSVQGGTMEAQQQYYMQQQQFLQQQQQQQPTQVVGGGGKGKGKRRPTQLAMVSTQTPAATNIIGAAAASAGIIPPQTPLPQMMNNNNMMSQLPMINNNNNNNMTAPFASAISGGDVARNMPPLRELPPSMITTAGFEGEDSQYVFPLGERNDRQLLVFSNGVLICSKSDQMKFCELDLNR